MSLKFNKLDIEQLVYIYISRWSLWWIHISTFLLSTPFDCTSTHCLKYLQCPPSQIGFKRQFLVALKEDESPTDLVCNFWGHQHIGAQVFFRLFWWDFRWFTFSFTFFGDFSSEIFGDSPFSSPFLVTFPVMNFAIHYIHHRFWWLSCHLFCHFDISLSFYLFWPFFRWPFRQPYKFITIFGASLVTFFVPIFFLPFYSPCLSVVYLVVLAPIMV